MGYEANTKAEDESAKRRSNSQKAIAVLAILILNGLAFYGFLNIPKMQSYNESMRYGSLEEGSKLQTGSIVEESGTILARQNDSLEEIRELRRELRNARDRLDQAQEKHMTLLTEIQANIRAIPDAQTDEDRDSTIKALNESIEKDTYHRWMLGRRNVLPAELREYVAPKELPFGFNSALRSDQLTASVGHACVANIEDITKFMSYEVGKVCPADDNLAQKLLLAGCEPLPRRRCLARGPQNPTEPLPHPDALWKVPDDGNINWEAYDCKSFECLNTRAAKKAFADCIDCFDLSGRESRRWVGRPSNPPGTAYTVDQVVALKNGGLRIGLDIGGTGSFAARMREHNVTIITSTLNLNGPFNNFIAQRGVLPFFMSIGQRFPFWDNTLDMVHSMHVLSNWIPLALLEFILFDIDRVLRPGGTLWLEHFSCVRSELDSTFSPLIRMLGYTELRWDVSHKLDHEVYLSALLQKPFSVRH